MCQIYYWRNSWLFRLYELLSCLIVMAGRFTDIKPLVRCLSPVSVYRDGHYLSFPCGKCQACQLDKANNWSMRLVDEIENTPFSIFFTLTYNNKYIPKLKFVPSDGLFPPFYTSTNDSNIRFNGVEDVVRDDNIQLDVQKKDIIIQNYGDTGYLGYCCKRDIQLWLKLLRKDLNEHFDNLDKNGKEKTDNYRFRYYIISEYGPTTFRPHYHGILFFHDCEAASYALQTALYKNWQMCDKSLFDEYTHLCDSGAAQYVTNYVTGTSRLPQVFKSSEIKPFRLSSKNPAVGFISYSRKEIFENVLIGVIEYNKQVSRIESTYILRYPSQYCRRLFPKCREYNLASSARLHYVYGFIYRHVVEKSFDFAVVTCFLRKKWFAADYSASLACYRSCLEFGCDVDTYLQALDMYYYKEQMCALKKFYEWQEKQESVTSIIFSYSNFQELCKSYKTLSSVERYYIDVWFDNFGLDAFTFCSSVKDFDLIFHDEEKDTFALAVEDILNDSIKLPKFNEKFGLAPHSI